ncbi:MAG: hypothetical protein ABSF16_15950 [Terracidiphilus sp.]|jgi:hypothetical protein
MRWLIIVLLVSLLALLIAAASVACHILIQRARLRCNSQKEAGKVLDPVDEADPDLEP